ncbi:hypothetical protein ACFVZH_02405 [Streptomyces sp. NPDC059534]|uniref:hypothetical protein n=1 Tax=Streptomyces sp. NPDC059534 TaxID=3346859 RepID=UPI00369DA204
MDHPGRGVPFSIRALATAIGRHPSLIGHLLTGERDDLESEDAQATAEVLGVALLVLFAPPASPNQNSVAPEK